MDILLVIEVLRKIKCVFEDGSFIPLSLKLKTIDVENQKLRKTELITLLLQFY